MIQKLQCLITALKAESDPFIQHLRLKRDNALDFPYFVNQKLNVGLIGVGVGKKNIKSRINDFLKLNNHKKSNLSMLVLLVEKRVGQTLVSYS